MEKIIFTADMHGNIAQYQKVLDYSQKNNADIIVFGGDLTPKSPERRTPEKQRAFLQEELFPLLDTFRKESDIHILFIMGNDDFRSNHSVMVDGQEYHGYRMIDQIPYITKSGYNIIGYSYVPTTPFRYKCWERRDCIEDTDFSHRPDTLVQGVISVEDDLVPYQLDPMNGNSIEDDLNNAMAEYDPRKTIIVSHAPPYNTVCDIINSKQHVGSRALRKLIENKQPLLTLHGHIHETVDVSGQFSEQIGDTFALSAGNNHITDSPYILEIELSDHPVFKRRQLTA